MTATVKVDYLSFTLQQDSTPERLMQLLGGKWRELGHGRHGYRNSAVSEVTGQTIYWEGHQADMGVHVQMTGDGCRMVESSAGFEWLQWLKDLLGLGVRFSRADLAVDDVAGKVPFETVLQAVEDRTLVRRGDTYSVMKTVSKGVVSNTLYVGHRSSEVMLRVYDKGVQLGGESYLRFETEWKGKRADAFVRLLAESGWASAVAAVRGCFEFKVPDGANRSRWPVASWWAGLMGSARHILRAGELAQKTLDSTCKWLSRQVSCAMAVVLEVSGGDLGVLYSYAEMGQKRLKARHRKMIAEGTWGGSLAALGA